jgi:serine/threonine protein phosphatase 1
LIKKLASFLKLDRRAGSSRRARLSLDMTDLVVYAIGDVHGCHDELLALERKIVADAANVDARKLIIMLGDYVDRGPASSLVIDHLLAPPPEGFERICLAGNHELIMLEALDGTVSLKEWTDLGATPTLRSYGVDYDHLRRSLSPDEQLHVIKSTIPPAHIAFMRSLPILVDSPEYLFVHAGIRPGVELKKQPDHDLAFIRSDFFNGAHLLQKWVVHGHTPVEQARLEGRRLNLDTGAFRTGRLTAARIWGNKGRVLST